jgi:hypothetical protein
MPASRVLHTRTTELKVKARILAFLVLHQDNQPILVPGGLRLKM